MMDRRTLSCSLLFVLVASSPAAFAQATSEPPQVVASGEGSVKAVPDRAWITIGAESRAKVSKEAQQHNAEAMTAVQQRLAAARVAKDAIRTLGYDLEQEFDFVQGKRVPREFVARNAVELRVDEITRVGELLDVAVQGGATSVSGVRFDIQDREKVEREALRLAVVDARSRAEAAAAGAGRAIDRIIKIEDARELSAPPRPMMTYAMKTADAAPTPVEPGLIEIRSRVTVTTSMIR